jgi:hypothetical protein
MSPKLGFLGFYIKLGFFGFYIRSIYLQTVTVINAHVCIACILFKIKGYKIKMRVFLEFQSTSAYQQLLKMKYTS